MEENEININDINMNLKSLSTRSELLEKKK